MVLSGWLHGLEKVLGFYGRLGLPCQRGHEEEVRAALKHWLVLWEFLMNHIPELDIYEKEYQYGKILIAEYINDHDGPGKLIEVSVGDSELKQTAKLIDILYRWISWHHADENSPLRDFSHLPIPIDDPLACVCWDINDLMGGIGTEFVCKLYKDHILCAAITSSQNIIVGK